MNINSIAPVKKLNNKNILNKETKTNVQTLIKPYTGSNGYVVGIYFNSNNNKIVAGVLMPNNRYIILPNSKIVNGLNGITMSQEQLLSISFDNNFISVYLPGSNKVYIWPRLRAEGRGFTGYIVTDNNNPFAGKSFDQIKSMLNSGNFRDPCTGQTLPGQPTNIHMDNKGISTTYTYREKQIDVVLVKSQDFKDGKRVEPEHVDLTYKHAQNSEGKFDKLKFPLDPSRPEWKQMIDRGDFKECKQLPDYTNGRGPDGGGGGGNSGPGGGSTGGFQNNVNQNGLTASYNSTNPNNQLANANAQGEIGGVAIQDPSAIMLNFNNSLYDLSAKGYWLSFPFNTSDIPFNNKELRQIIRELAQTIYIHNTFPFYSLHFTKEGTLYSVIHPAYQNTLVGKVIGMLDYFMKGYLNGGYFDESSLEGLVKNKSEWINKHDNLKPHIRSMDSLYKTTFASDKYSSLSELIENFQIKQYNILGKLLSGEALNELQQRFQISFRIIAKEDSIEKSGSTLLFNSNFDVFYTIELHKVAIGELDKYKESDEYQMLDHFCQHVAMDIKKKLPQLPICKSYFKMLDVICGLSYYFSSLKKNEMMPHLSVLEVDKEDKCLGMFPPYPTTKLDAEIKKNTLWDFIQELDNETKNELRNYLNGYTTNVSPQLQTNITNSIKKRIPSNAVNFSPDEINELVRIFTNNALKYVNQFRKEVNSEEFTHNYNELSNALQNISRQEQENINEQLQILSPQLEQQKNEAINEIEKSFAVKSREIENLSIGFNQKIKYKYATYESYEIGSLKNTMRRDLQEEKESNKKKLYQKIEEIKSDAIEHIRAHWRNLRNKVQQDINKLNTLKNSSNQDPIQKEIAEKIELNLPLVLKNLSTLAFANENQLVKINGGTGFNFKNEEVVQNTAITVNLHDQLFSKIIKEESWQPININGKNYQAFYVKHIKLNEYYKKELENSIHKPNMAKTEKEKRLIYLSSQQFSAQQLEEVTQLLKSIPQANINKTDAYGNNALHLAAMNNNLDLLKILLKKRVSSKLLNQFGNSALHVAAMYGYEDALKEIYNHDNTSIKVLTMNDESALYLAVLHHHLHIVKYLHECCGLDINEVGVNGFPLIYTALYNHSLEIVNYLLNSNKISIKFQLENGNTLLHLAAELDTIDIIKKLIDKRIDTSLYNRNGKTAAHILAEKGYLISLKVLIPSANNLLEQQNSSNLTPLYLAIQNGHEEVCEYLISIGANIHLLVDNKNALAYALKNKQLKCIELTLERTNFIFNNQYDMGNFLLMCKLGLWEFCEKIIAKFPQLAITPLEDRHKSFDEVVCYLDYICKNNEYLIFTNLLKRKEVNSIGYLWDNVQSIYRIAIRYGSKEILAKLNTLGIVNPFNYNSQIFINQGSQFMSFKSYDLIQLAVKQNIPLIYNKYLEIDNIDIEHSTTDGKNLIYLAAESGNQKLVSQLIEKGAKLVAPNGKHIFYALTLNNHCHIIRHLVLRYQFDINAVIDEEYKLRTIDLACKQGNIETIVALIGYGAAIDVPNSNKYLPVYYAIENNAPQVIRLIFKYELGNLVDILSFAIKCHHNEVLGEILKNRPNYKGEILKFGLELMQVAIESRNLKVFKLLVEIGVNPNNEFLHLAIRKGYHEILSLLIANGVDVNYQNEEGNTAFNLAIQLGKNLCLNELLKINNLNQSIKNEGIVLEERNLWIKHIISNNQSDKINSELVTSIKTANIDKFTQVIKRYAIPINWSINYEYKTEKIVGSLLDVAILEYQPPIIEYLLSQSELNPYEINSLGLTAVHLLMKNVDATYTIKLIENFKLDLNIINPNNGCNLLHFAVLTKNNAMIDYLINKQVDIHAEMSDGQTIMHLAIQQKSFDLVKKLIEHHGYSIHHKNSQQESCLAVALKNGNLVIAEYLVSMGANIFERDGFKERTMLHYAVMSEDIKVVFFVLTCGVNTRTCDNMKMLPIHLAAKQGNTSIIELLSEQDSLLLTPTDIRNRNVKDFALIHKKIDTTKYLTKKYGVVNKKSVTEDKEINFKKYRFGDKTQLELAIIAEDQVTIASLIDNLPENDLETIKKAIAIAGGCSNFNIFVYILNRLWDGENKQVLRSSMMAAIANNRVANIRELLNLIGSEIVFDDGNTPLKLAAECDSLEIFKEVYQYNKDYFVQVSSQEIYSIFQNIIKNNNLTMAKILGENYSNDIINFTDANGNTLLHHAVLNNKPNMLAYFMMNGWVDKNNHANMSALDIATKKKYSECVRYLSVVNNNSGVIQEMSDIQSNSSPLTNAYKTNNREIFKWLLEQGFNPYIVSFKSNNLNAESRKDMSKIYKDWYEDQIDEILKLLNYNVDFKNVDTFINMFDLLLVKLAKKCNLSKDMNHSSWNQLFVFMEIGLKKLNSTPKVALDFPYHMVNKIKNTYANREYFSIIEKILGSQYFLRLVKKLIKSNQNKNLDLPNARCGGGLI